MTAVAAILQEPDVQRAIEVVAGLRKISPKVLEAIFDRFRASRFFGREAAYWTRTLLVELEWDQRNATAKDPLDVLGIVERGDA